MNGEIMGEIPSILNSIQNHWQFMSLCAILMTIILYVYWKYLKKESDLLVHKVQELEEARTMIRKQDRDKQIATLESYFKSELLSTNKRMDTIDTKTDGIGRSFDRSCNDSQKKFEKLDLVFERIDQRMIGLEKDRIKETEFNQVKNTVQKIEVDIAAITASIKFLVDGFQEIKQLVGRPGRNDY